MDTLVGPGYEGYAIRNPRTSRVRTVFDGFRNFGSEAGKSIIRDGTKHLLKEVWTNDLL